MGRVDGEVVLLTGAASGLGAASAKLLAEEGATVVLADVNVAGGKELAADISGSAIFIELDTSNEPAWESSIAAVMKQFGRFDVLVNNAGVLVTATIEDTSYEQLKFIRRNMKQCDRVNNPVGK